MATTTTFAIASPTATPPNGTVPFTSTDYCDLKRAGLWSGPIPDQGPSSLAAIWALFAAATIFVSLRFYCKVWRHKGLWWDDLFMGLSWICFLIEAIFCHRVITHGFGKYPCDIPPQNFRIIKLEGDNLGATFTMLAMMWSKTSFAVVLLRLTHGKLKGMVWFTIASVNILMGIEVILIWVKCTPVASSWDRTILGTCWDTKYVNGAGVFAGCLSGVCDIVLSLLPWTLIWNLRMKKREKLGIGIAMSMGIFAGVTAFVKSASILALGGKNFTYDAVSLLVWSAAEVSTTMMATSIPVLRVLFRDLHGLSRVNDEPPNGLEDTGYSFSKPGGDSVISYHEMLRRS